MPAATATAERAQDLLTTLAGPDAVLRDDQAEAIGALADDRRRVLLVQRTGWGKSAVYWIATALRRATGAGPTLVVSPLLALMRDQVEAARRLGLSAETINSTNADEWDRVLALLDDDAVDVLLISPERLNAPSFRDRLAVLAPRLGLLVVDEAHCVSDWGHDFRPDYRRIRDLLEGLPDGTPVLACTATANARVTADVATQLGDDVLTLRGRLGRDSLQLAVLDLPDGESRLAWLDAFVASHRPVHGRAGIVYTLTVDDTSRVAAFLAERGRDAVAYSSAVEPEEREAIEARLKANELDVVVATSALGMGFDKPDLAFVVHLGAPSSPVAYYQQVGRAGRAIDTAEVVLLPTRKDADIWRHFDLAGIPSEREVERVLGALSTEEPRSVPMLEQAVDVRRSRLDLLLKVLDVDGAVEKAGSGWVATGVPWAYDRERYRALAELRRGEHAAMARLTAGALDGCLMRFLAEQLDDPDATACGRCQGCTGWEPDVGVSASVADEARAFLRERDVLLRPRRMWPPGLDEVRGRIAKGRGPLEGRALAGGDDSGWGEVVDRLLASLGEDATGTPDEAALTEVVDGLVRVLARWDWPTRPSAIVPVPSPPYAALTRTVCVRLGVLGRLPVVEALAWSPGPSQAEQANSPHKAANALARLTTTPAAAELPTGGVLLVDTATDTGWTLTAGAWRVTEPAPRPVLPLVLTTRPA
ncbi:MAG: RecQ family ATP-dependent DNA helicase [Actinomycetes bacterium]